MTADSPRDYSPEAEGPRDICANLAQTFRGLAASGYMRGFDRGPFISYTDWSRWADRLERAVQKLDAAQSPPEGPWRFVGQVTEGGDWHIEHELTHDCMSFWRERDAHTVADALNRVAVPPTEQDTPHPSLPAPEDRPQ